MEKAERAGVPTKWTLGQLKLAYMWLRSEDKWNAKMCLMSARDYALNQQEASIIQSVRELLDKPQEAMARIADILTCGGLIYDEFSEFLRGEK